MQIGGTTAKRGHQRELSQGAQLPRAQGQAVWVGRSRAWGAPNTKAGWAERVKAVGEAMRTCLPGGGGRRARAEWFRPQCLATSPCMRPW